VWEYDLKDNDLKFFYHEPRKGFIGKDITQRRKGAEDAEERGRIFKYQ